MTAPGVVPLLVVGLLAGLLAGVLGVGGGIVIVPLLVGGLRFDQHRAHATSLAAIVLISLSGVVRFALSGEVDFARGLAIGAGGVIGSTLGANLMDRLSPRALKVVFGTIMILAGARMVLGGDPGLADSLDAVGSVFIGVGIGLVAGVASGVAGIGGGVILVPAMVFLLGMSQHSAEGTSLLAILFTALAGTRVNFSNHRVDLRQAMLIGGGGIVTAALGASLALLISAPVLTQVFGVFVAVVGIRMIVTLVRQQNEMT